MRKSLVFSVLVLILLLYVDYMVCQMRFQLIQDGNEIAGLQPYRKETMSSKSRCYLMCQQTPGQCCYVQLVHQQEDGQWICSLYEFVGDINKYLSPSPGSVISAPKANPQMDCLDWLRLGYTKDSVYYINFNGYRRKVFCDMTTEGGGWIVMQKRFDGSEDFYRDWVTYKEGFGNVDGEYWLGNEFIHQYTTRFSTTLRVDASGFDGQTNFITLDGFYLQGEASKYRIYFTANTCRQSSSPHNLCYAWNFHRGFKFSTKDQDNDDFYGYCANFYQTGWWLGQCTVLGFNGPYSADGVLQYGKVGIHWIGWYPDTSALKETTMLIRRDP
ncbi:microfibril-associated glycoprotein 4-like [Clytia hemisphaerica]|uniref:microfibril-associated glycoprotein 4-like n=1 Tax=Clytia hemisphaerica TaxID=252671 RepID=UPI0034D603EF